jgi:hypothetical protein
MTKHLLNWKNINCKCAGKNVSLPVANEIDGYYSGTLLSRILAMERKTPIALEAAIHLLVENEHAARAAGRTGTDPGHLFWYAYHFIEWIAEIGYHIELTGEEFEAPMMSDKIA